MRASVVAFERAERRVHPTPLDGHAAQRETGLDARQRGRQHQVVEVADMADPQLQSLCQDFQWIGWGSLGRAIKFFQRCGIERATMAGKFHKVVMYQPGVWWRHLPDWTFIKTFYRSFITQQGDNKDDSLLGALVNAFAAKGIVFQPATDFAPELLIKAGQIAGRPPSAPQQKDIEFGWQLAKQMGRLDICVVYDGMRNAKLRVDDMLVEEPVSFLTTDTYYRTPAQLESGVLAAYNSVRSTFSANSLRSTGLTT